MPKKEVRILAVDDEIADLNLMCNVLRAENHTVFAAASYAEAIQIHRMRRGAIDLLVADVSLPDKNGCELALTLLETDPDLKVLFVSGATGTEVLKFSKISDVHLLEKPFGRAELVSRVRDILEGSVPIRTNSASE
jgi:two-component system, cell cycle sensor histidine kinase and response regulator CckA